MNHILNELQTTVMQDSAVSSVFTIRGVNKSVFSTSTQRTKAEHHTLFNSTLDRNTSCISSLPPFS